MTNFEKNLKQRQYRKKNGNLCTTKYERSLKGFIMRKYRNMESRIKGIQKLKHHLYQGKELLGRETFYKWCHSSEQLEILYKDWVNSDYQMKLSPSVDRIDPAKGYTLSNMEWITHSENSRRGAINRNKMKI